ncbi:diphosphomevalonate/mevalonate 3,5-bisphosphate decarboxylase family protein [Tenacibaculum finnmarkense]|uniref:diphosphomevalonate/mevalonate 3,5-bisphosphate decarboxylase family protein n=1 Tax=Tenacibaculum finnmarkense TaxID=2781243 RepID=UPI001E45498E|nr:diphosphomevalonate decarboxylase [Tenacibaculum finnmarkense]MCD8421872.1 diphosphomevalonate decarboxylase [Tenacibaculum finnmarkense genomovar ulcerans]MCD8431467.1 diphosphomevalonate decarboxylase [Tenacibaculum finnmarkense genomovar ulcerans]MCG8237999.1 diphosphomevalonate decarboxylase [Tenacibaculum finnmarkense genomovar ulcerans]MCG8868443.1 diphosphomevalonate decarboxylase [Tenacibaculum finnmarkense]
MNTADFISKKVTETIQKATYTWQTPSNIALVKYWGKSEPQIPKNASISFTLNNCHTITTIEFEKIAKSNTPTFELFFEGKKKEDFKPKIAKFFERIQEYCPYILDYKMIISSENSFPHSSGIASSASGMSAIAMCLLSLEKALNPALTADFIHKKASFLARLGSGSASRSIEGPLVVWGKHPQIEGSSDLFAVKFPYKTHPIFENYCDTILLVDKGEKQVSSTVGHNLMHEHPYAEQRFIQANENLSKLSEILQNGKINEFITLVESEALTLHAMMLTSNPYFILMKPNTLEVINKIWEYRAQNNSNICFTLDAGANVHVLYPENEKKNVELFIKNKLADYCQKNQYITDYVGLGAKEIHA